MLSAHDGRRRSRLQSSCLVTGSPSPPPHASSRSTPQPSKLRGSDHTGLEHTVLGVPGMGVSPHCMGLSAAAGPGVGRVSAGVQGAEAQGAGLHSIGALHPLPLGVPADLSAPLVCPTPIPGCEPTGTAAALVALQSWGACGLGGLLGLGAAHAAGMASTGDCWFC